MSSTVCRCFGGTACPESSSDAEDFFTDIHPDKLAAAVADAVSDYVRLRGLNGLCPDVRKWSSPPGPAAFLDAGLPKNSGTGSLPRGLSTNPVNVPHKTDRGSPLVRGGGARRRRHKRANSIPPPTWEAKGPEGTVSQVLSFDDTGEWGAVTTSDNSVSAATLSGLGGDDVGGTRSALMQTSYNQGIVGSRSTPELGGNVDDGSVAVKILVESPSVDAKQLLRSLRQNTTDNCQHRRGRSRNGVRPCLPGRGSGDFSGKHAMPGNKRAFSPPDAWDDTGLFTVAPRPKTVPSGRTRRQQQHTLAAGVTRPSPRPLLTPPISGGRAGCKRDPLRKPEDSVGKNLIGAGFGIWSESRRVLGGGGGDAAVEFLDIREAALVSVVEALARRALPWQAQLCPRALQDLEVARVRVFHTVERERQAGCEARQESFLRGLLLGEERSWELFARGQRCLFENALEKITDCVNRWEAAHVADLSIRLEWSKARAQRGQNHDRYSTDHFEDSETNRAWLHRRTTHVDMMWEPSTSIQAKQAEQQRAAAARDKWGKAQGWAMMRSDTATWLEAAGARALASQELARWERSVAEMMHADESRTFDDRARERQRVAESYLSVLRSASEADRHERATSAESWNLQGWLSVGSHKLVQQTLRALVRRCSHPYTVRNILWEARQAAEFAASARVAAASQRAADARVLCSSRSERKATVREHKRDLLQAEEKRAIDEDAERVRAAQQVPEALRASALARTAEANAQLQGERARTVASRETEAERSVVYQEDAAALAGEVDKETERVAVSLRGRRDEEEKQIKSEVSAAESSLREEQGRADERESNLHEMLLRERDKEDRLLRVWMGQREREETKAVDQHFTDTTKRLAEERERWATELTASMEGMTSLATSFLRDPLTWTTAVSSTTTQDSTTTTGFSPSSSLKLLNNQSSAIWAGVNNCQEAARVELAAAVASKNAVHRGVERAAAVAEVEARAANTRGARLESTTKLACQGLAAHWREFWRDDIERARLAAAAGDMAAARWERHQKEAAEAFWAAWRNKSWSISVKTEATKAATKDSTATTAKTDIDAEVEAGPGQGGEEGTAQVGTEQDKGDSEMGARERQGTGSRKGEGLESAVVVAVVAPVLDARQCFGGQRVHAEQENTEKTLPTPEQLVKNNRDDRDGVSGGRDIAGALLGSKDRGETYAGAACPRVLEDHTGGVVSVALGGTTEDTPHGSPFEAVSPAFDAAARATDAPGLSTSGVKLAHSTQPMGTAEEGAHAAAKGVAALASGAANAILTLTVHRVEAAGRGVNTAGTLLPGAATAITANKLVVYVGSSTARHLSTFRQSYMENFEHHRRRCSSFAAQRSGVMSSSGSATDDDIFGPEHNDMEAEWLKVLERAVGENDVIDLAEVGGALETVPGGVAVLCLTHDCIVDDDREQESFVRTEILLPAAEALVTLRRRMRIAGILALETEKTEDLGEAGETAELSALAVLSAVAKMEAAVEFDVMGEELAADLTKIFACSGESTPSHVSQTARVRRAVQKHRALLSPQSVCALTALLSARGRSWLHNGGGAVDDCGGTSCLSTGSDVTAWEKIVSDALLAVRMVTLEHAIMWAKACDPENTESACRAYVAESTGSRCNDSTKGQGCPQTLADDLTEAIWAAVNSVSGLGLSPLLLSAATLLDQGMESSPSLVAPASATGQDETTTIDDGSRDEGRNHAAGGLISTFIRSALRLLTCHSLENVAQCLSQCRTTAIAAPRQDENDSSHLVFDPHKPEFLSDIPGHPAIGDLSGLNAETLRKGAGGLIAALDAKNTGMLPPAALLAALQGGQAGFRLEFAQACVVLRLAGCLGPARTENHGDHSSSEVDKATTVDTIGWYCYLGYPPGCGSVRYCPLVDKISGSLRLVQAAHRLRRAAGMAGAPDSVEDMGCAALERAREGRRRRGLEMGAAAFIAALDTVCRRMEYSRLQGRSSMLEAPRLEAMRRLSAHAQEIASAVASTRSMEFSHRIELRDAFTAAVQERTVAVSSATSSIISATASVAAELWRFGGETMEIARNSLTHTVERVGGMVAEAQEILDREERGRTTEDDKARELQNEAPAWWGEGLTQEVEASYRQEAMLGQETAAGLLEAASGLERDMGVTWKEDVEQCKEGFLEMETKLDIVMAGFEERRTSSKEAMSVVRTATMSPPQQADFAELVQTRHEGITLCRETLTWLGVAANDLEAECLELCAHAEGMPTRAEKRLDGILKNAGATAAKERSIIARRLHAVSNSWGEDIPQRTQRWGEFRTSRRVAYEWNRAAIEAADEISGPTAAAATLARIAALAQGRQTAEAAVRHFLESAGHGPAVTEASTTASAAARAMTQSHEAVSSIIAAAEAEGEVVVEDHEARAARVLAIESEDTAVRVRECHTAVREWWAQMVVAAVEGLHDRERELEERRVRAEVRHLLSDSLVSEVEARHEADTLAKKTLGFVLAQSQRVAEQFVAGERSATNRVIAAAADSRAAIERETQVLSLEAQALSQRVSATLQRGLDAAAEDLVAAQRKNKDRDMESHPNRENEALLERERVRSE